MNRRFIKKSLLVMLLSLSMASTAWGSNIPVDRNKQGNKSNVMTEGINPRGIYIALGFLEITNLGSGNLGIFIQTICHEDVEKIKQRVYLDKYSEKTNAWQQVAYYDFNYLSEDYDNTLSAPYEDFQVRAEVGSYYRIRGMHAVWKNGKTESFYTETSSVQVTR